jgi:hypothetical protein
MTDYSDAYNEIIQQTNDKDKIFALARFYARHNENITTAFLHILTETEHENNDGKISIAPIVALLQELAERELATQQIIQLARNAINNNQESDNKDANTPTQKNKNSKKAR